MDIHASSEPMTLGSPTSPKPGPGAQFLPGFLMGDLPAPASPQPRAFSLSTPTTEHRSFQHTGGSQPVVPAPKDKSGAPPIRSIYDDLTSTAAIATTPLSSHKQPFSMFQSPLLGSTPGTVSSSSCRQVILSPAQVDPFYSQGEALSSDDHLDQTWVTVFGFPPASASYILLQFAQYGNILKHTMSSPGNWMHLQYQSVLQARKALSKDGKVFGDWLMVGVKPCIDKAVMEASEAVNNSTIISPAPSALFSPAHGGLPSTPRSSMRPLSAAYKASSDDYQVLTDRQTPRKEDSMVNKAMTYMFGW